MFCLKCDIFVRLPPNSGHLLITDKTLKTRKCPLFRGFTVFSYVYNAFGKHWAKSVGIWSYSSPYFPTFEFLFFSPNAGNADHNNSEYGHFSCSEASSVFCKEIPSDTLCMLDNKNSWFKLVIK